MEGGHQLLVRSEHGKMSKNLWVQHAGVKGRGEGAYKAQRSYTHIFRLMYRAGSSVQG
jgi:hypothetical protein